MIVQNGRDARRDKRTAYQGPFSVSCSEQAHPITTITRQVTEVTCPVIGRAQPELTPSKRQKTGPEYNRHRHYGDTISQPVTIRWGRYIKNNAWLPWITIFLSRVGRFGNDFHEWRSHEWKSSPNRLTSDKKSLFRVTNVLFYFLHVILCDEHKSAKNYHRALISSLLPRAVFPDLALWRQQNWSVTRDTGIVTSYSSIGIARAKAIFTSE